MCIRGLILHGVIPQLLILGPRGVAASSSLPLRPSAYSPGSTLRSPASTWFCIGIAEYFKSALRQPRKDFIAGPLDGVS
jgi:hypothetical protein